MTTATIQWTSRSPDNSSSPKADTINLRINEVIVPRMRSFSLQILLLMHLSLHYSFPRTFWSFIVTQVVNKHWFNEVQQFGRHYLFRSLKLREVDWSQPPLFCIVPKASGTFQTSENQICDIIIFSFDRSACLCLQSK